MSERSKRGPKPERVKIDEDWEDAIDKALRKKRPDDGWPDNRKEEPHQNDESEEVE